MHLRIHQEPGERFQHHLVWKSHFAFLLVTGLAGLQLYTRKTLLNEAEYCRTINVSDIDYHRLSRFPGLFIFHQIPPSPLKSPSSLKRLQKSFGNR